MGEARRRGTLKERIEQSKQRKIADFANYVMGNIKKNAGLLEQLIDALDNQWQPIETAPRDGTRFLVYFSSGLIDKCWSFKDLLFFDRGQNDTVQNIGYTPTHWQPLPQPSKQ